MSKKCNVYRNRGHSGCSVEFRIRVATGHNRVGSVSHGSVEDKLFEISSLHRFGVD